ncbi:GGDEF domain-containing protein [Mesorhizobium sp. M0761]|uniref:GGDEF domain-containing protein n=1 Tax=unclassified Mesorhizobium TaxID=325217 RepID=UPI0003CE2D6F|nr:MULTISPECIES: GGDEF domain-containing protein [unclassified Mesorhizobium]ESX17173.1 diguanylate cyclase [Mesorhizobium sp. LSJC255A00]ESX32671.1 diguanylate cyclase [Mesorhizobium sp. LSHC440B00]ESX38609.1 diguanylate cyclase [Mesorhizobium sp. LSHC432A00]ESX41806.1 diguanylate cyclase [Mesorhizobium sp. LSHC440A00]ESX67337.1 diguanylate cyclase [Mesorhizobium sp. LSHC414A00]
MLNSFLLLAEAVVYFSVMVTLFRFRDRIGLGVFVCALGAMHFLETYLASVFYVALPFGMVSPGSAVLFSGKLVMLLLLYMKEDAATVRQPIYGLLLGNALMIGLVLILRLHDISALSDGKLPDIGFIDQLGWLMVWGTTLLFIDAILIILLYEKLGRYLRKAPFSRILICVACVLTFDQAGFFTALHFVAGAPIAVFFGGWLAKMGAAFAYSAMLVAYLRWFETRQVVAPRGLSDVFDTLTYRERYEALVEHVGRDGLTGLLHRGRFDSDGERLVAVSLRTAQPLSLLIVDVDHFKSINDRFGHAEGDRVLRSIAQVLTQAAGAHDQVFRIGGEEFAILCSQPHAVARLLGENLRQAVKACVNRFDISVSAGIATVDETVGSLADLFALADERLYRAKSTGRDRVVGEAHDDAEDLTAWTLPTRGVSG